MKNTYKLTIIAILCLMASCASFHSCPTYAVVYKNETTGRYGVEQTDVVCFPGDCFTMLPSGDKISVIDIKLN